MIVDAHHHFWNIVRNPLPWMTPDHGAIDGAWLPLADPSRCRRRLAELAHQSKFRAVCHLIHDEPDPHWNVSRAAGVG